jgi:hypothetical protein
VLVDSMSVESVLDDSMQDESMSFEAIPTPQAPGQPASSEPSTGITDTVSSTTDVESSVAELTVSNPGLSSAAVPSFPFDRSVTVPVTQPAPESTAILDLAQRSPEPAARMRAENAPRPAELAGKFSSAVLGYAVSLTLIFLFCLFTGRLSLRGNHPLESLPDIRPIPSNEFRKVPEGTDVPAGHVLNLGESRRYGDVVLTPVRVTREPLTFQHFLTGKTEAFLTTEPVLKLWLKFENVSANYGFPPFDTGLMSHRAPRNAMGRSAAVNSFLNVTVPSNGEPATRVLNYLHTMDSNFVITGQESAGVVMPGETLTTFTACDEEIQSVEASSDTEYSWRVQFRKGVHQTSGNGVTTLVDVIFHGSEIAENVVDSAPPGSPGAG